MGASRCGINRQPVTRVLFRIGEVTEDAGTRGEVHISLDALRMCGQMLLEERHGPGEVALLVFKTRRLLPAR